MRNRRAAYIGAAAVVAYDYRNPGMADRSSNEVPNPILENVPGLLLAYDELYFLSREFCPRDMQDLPYVHFVSEIRELVPRARTAHEQYVELARGIDFSAAPSPGPLSFDDIVNSMVGDLRESMAPDNHSRGITLSADYSIMGNSGEFGLVVADIGTALALDIEGLDVIVSSRGSGAVRGLEIFAEEHNRSTDLWRLSSASRLAEIYTPSYLGLQGAYHPAYEELRGHPRVSEFRDFLHEVDPPHRDGELLAKEISQLADRHASDILERFVKGKNKFRSLGVPVVGGVLNVLLPGAGSAVTGGNSALEYLSEKRLRDKISWAPFVVDLRRQRS
ncbi:hypothetical protein AB0346_00330 [Nocardia beijingensis]|uniref:hypothetical protein n=1 Tax=Nocardia beijingensis TaxID=95162 RepID=UPI0034509641